MKMSKKLLKTPWSMHRVRIVIQSLILLLAIYSGTLLAQTRQLTDADRQKVATFKFSEESKNRGMQQYNNNCRSCHGDPGKRNYSNLDPIPGDPASDDYQALTDGEMFFYVTNGKGQLMPMFANALSESQRWDVISYIRSFNPNYIQAEVKLAEEVNLSGALRLKLDIFEDEKRVVALLTDSTSGFHKPIKGATIKLSVKRYFGNLPIGESQTDEFGIAAFDFPPDIPGNEEGLIEMLAFAGNGDKEISISQVALLGVKFFHKNLLDDRSWFNVNKKAPIWIVLTYLLALVLVGGILLYVLLQLKKIKEMNKE
jgi:mono/diheme cytochrome c family protein